MGQQNVAMKRTCLKCGESAIMTAKELAAHSAKHEFDGGKFLRERSRVVPPRANHAFILGRLVFGGK